MRIRFIAAAVPVLVAGSLAAAAPGLSQAANDDKADRMGPPETVSSAKLAVTDPCTGGKQKKAFSGGNSGWFSTSSSDFVPGTLYQFKGPKKKKDTVFVTVTAPGTYSDLNDYGRVRVLLNGVDLAPSAGSSEYAYSDNNYASFAGQYCAKVGKGNHRVRVELQAFDGNGSGTQSSYLLNPMIHVEVAE